MRKRIGTPHRLEHSRAGVLQGDVEVRAENRPRVRHDVEQSVGHVHRLDRTQSDVHITLEPGDGHGEVGQRRWRIQVAAVRSEMNAGDPDLGEAGVGGTFDRRKDGVGGVTDGPAARRRHDAVATVLVTAGLHAERVRRSAAGPGAHEERGSRRGRSPGGCPRLVERRTWNGRRRVSSDAVSDLLDDSSEVGPCGRWGRAAT